VSETLTKQFSSVVDRSGAGTDFSFLCDSDPDPTPSFTLIGKSKKFFTLIHSNASLHLGGRIPIPTLYWQNISCQPPEMPDLGGILKKIG
jgi:hypothetical protein